VLRSPPSAMPRFRRCSQHVRQPAKLVEHVFCRAGASVVFQLPYRSGMSRHGALVRRTQRIPLTVRCLSRIGGPRSPRSGSSGLRMRHSASVRSPRLNAASSRKAALNQNSINIGRERSLRYRDDLAIAERLAKADPGGVPTAHGETYCRALRQSLESIPGSGFLKFHALPRMRRLWLLRQQDHMGKLVREDYRRAIEFVHRDRNRNQDQFPPTSSQNCERSRAQERRYDRILYPTRTSGLIRIRHL